MKSAVRVSVERSMHHAKDLLATTASLINQQSRTENDFKSWGDKEYDGLQP